MRKNIFSIGLNVFRSDSLRRYCATHPKDHCTYYDGNKNHRLLPRPLQALRQSFCFVIWGKRRFVMGYHQLLFHSTQRSQGRRQQNRICSICFHWADSTCHVGNDIGREVRMSRHPSESCMPSKEIVCNRRLNKRGWVPQTWQTSSPA